MRFAPRYSQPRFAANRATAAPSTADCTYLSQKQHSIADERQQAKSDDDGKPRKWDKVALIGTILGWPRRISICIYSI
jgi:hypothetical protein